MLRRVRAVVSSESLHSVQHMRRRLVRDDSVATRHLARSHRAFPFCSTKSSRAPPIRGSVRPMGMERCKHGGPAGDNSRRCPELPPVQRPAIPEPEAPTAVMSAACGPRRPAGGRCCERGMRRRIGEATAKGVKATGQTNASKGWTTSSPTQLTTRSSARDQSSTGNETRLNRFFVWADERANTTRSRIRIRWNRCPTVLISLITLFKFECDSKYCRSNY